jgi:hypothetical protein
MDEPLRIWGKLLLRLGLVLLALGLVPVLAIGTILPEVDPVLPVLLSLTVAPLGALSLVAALILFLAALVRRPPRGPS